METQSYIVLPGNDLARLEAEVNDRIEEGCAVAGTLFAVTPAQGGVLYVQPMVLELAADELGDEDDEDDPR